MEEIFLKLQDSGFFASFVTDYFSNAPKEIADVLGCEVAVDPALVDYAHKEYLQNIEYYTVRLNSANPDQYKRAGALLHALYQARIITAVSYAIDREEIASGMGPVGVHYADIESCTEFTELFDEYHNEMMSFFLAYRCCASYEDEARVYDFDYLQNVSVYMRRNTNISLDTFFMLFKSLMH